MCWHEVQTTNRRMGSTVPARYVCKEREGVNPKGNLNNGILFLYINKCSEKSQTLVHCCKKLVQYFSLKILALKE